MTSPTLIAALSLALGATAAAAEPTLDVMPGSIACGDHAALVEALNTRYRERQVSIGLQNNGQLLEVYASRATGSWTILSTRPDGVACIMAVGKHYEQKPVEDADGPSARRDGGRERAS